MTTPPGHSPTLREVRAGAPAGIEAETTETGSLLRDHFSYPSYTAQAHLPMDGAHSGLQIPEPPEAISAINYQSRKCPSDLPKGQTGEENSFNSSTQVPPVDKEDHSFSMKSKIRLQCLERGFILKRAHCSLRHRHKCSSQYPRGSQRLRIILPSGVSEASDPLGPGTKCPETHVI